MTPTLFIAMISLLLGGTIYAVITALAPASTAHERRRLAETTQHDATPSFQNIERPDFAPGVTILLRVLKLHDRTQWELVRAGLLLKPSEITALSLAAGGLVFLGTSLFTSRLPAQLLVVLLAMAAPWIYAMMRKGHRQKQITTQLPETLRLIASSLRSGFSILRALQVAADEMSPPISQEISWVLDEINVGVSREEAFSHMATRTQSPDVKLMVTAIQIQSKVGGNLAEILETTGDMIQQRFHLAAEIAALTAEGRLSAGVLTCLPMGLALIIYLLNPNYLMPLVTEPIGTVMLVAGAGLMLAGLAVIKLMLKVDV